MPIPAKMGTYNDGGGFAIMGAVSVIVQGRRASRKGDYVTGHPYLHPGNPIVLGSRSVIIEGREQGFLGSFDACGHRMIPHEASVMVGM
ncbi:hypothetical protein EB001_01590 [bacterium]|nr:hypothetical protein [bacterium]